MSRKWEDVIAVLKGEKATPLSQFIGYSGVLSEDQQTQLVAILEKSDFRRAIRFKGCGINDKIAARLAEVLKQNRFITSLELPGNQIGKDGCLALCRLLQDNQGITGFDLSGNPCEEESPETMTQLDMYLERNRELLSCNGSVCPSPASNSPRMQRTKARIVDVSSCTQPLVTSPGRQIPSPKRRGNSYTSDYDGMSLKSEQMSTCSEDGDFQTRILLLEERQTKLEQQADLLDQEAEEFHSWKEKFQASSQNAMESFLKYENQMHQSRKDVEELMNWRGSMEVILEVTSVKLQRQGGDFHGLRDKVLKLHTEFERVHRQLSSHSSGPLTPQSSLKGPVEITSTPSSNGKTQKGDMTLKEIQSKVLAQNETQRDLLEEFNKTRAMLEDVMRYYENCEHANATTKTNFESRLATLEKLGLFSDEQEASQSALSEALNGLELFRSAIEVQVDKIEKRITMAEKLNKQLDDIHKVGGEKSIKTAEDRWNSQFKQHKAEVAKLSTKIEEYDVATLQARKSQYDNSKDISDLQNQLTAAQTNQRALESRLNFQEELMMDKSHGEQDMDTAIAAHNTRLNSFEDQLRLLELQTPRIEKFESQIHSLEEKAQQIAGLETGINEIAQARKESTSALEERLSCLETSKASREDVTSTSSQCSSWAKEVRGCLQETEARLQGQLDTLVKKISSAEKSNQSEVAALQKEMATLGNSMQNLFSTLDKHLHAVEDQSTEISKRLQAEKAWKTSCAGKIKALEASSTARQQLETEWEKRQQETSSVIQQLSDKVSGLQEDRDSAVEKLEKIAAHRGPQRLTHLEQDIQYLQQEKAQMPSWVRRQALMENRLETLEEALQAICRTSENANLQQAINTRFSGQTMYCMAKRFPASYPLKDTCSLLSTEDATPPGSPTANKENNNSPQQRSTSDAKSGGKTRTSPSTAVESRALQPMTT